MKISRLLTIFFCVLVIQSCSKDVDPLPDPVQASFAGEWVTGIYLYEGHRTFLGQESFNYEEFTGFAYEINLSLNVSEGPNNYSMNGTYLLDHITTFESGQQTLQTSFEVINDQGQWLLNGNQITLILNGEERVGSIAMLTQDRMEIRFSTTTSEIIEDLETVTVNTSLNESYTFLRVN